MQYFISIGEHRLEIARIFCIGRNYRAHMQELSSEKETPCVLFMKPLTALVPAGHPVSLPRHRGAIHHEVELVVAVGKDGRSLTKENALEHVAGYSLGLDLTLRDEQNRLKAAGDPWESCKGFDQSAPLGAFVPAHAVPDPQRLELSCLVNGIRRQHGFTRDMIRPVAELLVQIGSQWRLHPGDLVFTGTPEGVGPVAPGDRVEVRSPAIGDFTWSMH